MNWLMKEVSPITRRPCWLSGLFLVFLLANARGQATQEILSLALTNYTGYVIAADAVTNDASFNRERLLVSARTMATNPTVGTVDASYHLSFRVLDTNGTAFPIFNHTGTATNAGYTLTVTNSIFLSGNGVVFRTNLGSIRPAARMNPHMPYRVELRLFRTGNIFTGDVSNTLAQTFYHFTNTVSGDAAYNVLSEVDSVSVSQPAAVKTDPERSAFKLFVGYTLRRYDNFAGSHLPAANVPVTLTVELRNAANNALVPLKDTTTNFTVSIQNYDTPPPNDPTVPATVFQFREIAVEPTNPTQLDSVNNTYRATVFIQHTEHPIANLTYTGNAITTPATRLLHFNGTLLFGSLPTTFLSIFNSPPVNAPTAAGVPTVLEVDNYSGFINSAPQFNYGDGSPLNVLLQSNGNAVYQSGNVVFFPTLDDGETLNGVHFTRTNLVLTTNGAAADLIVDWPAGFGTRTDANGRLLDPSITFTDVDLNASMLPAQTLLSEFGVKWGCEETKPILFEFNNVQWGVGQGRFFFSGVGDVKYVRSNEVAQLAATAADPIARTKPNNDLYWNAVSQISTNFVEVRSVQSAARITFTATIAPGLFQTHFPLGGLIGWNGTSEIRVEDDFVDPSESTLEDVTLTRVTYSQGCFGEGCDEGTQTDTFSLNPNGDLLYFTRDGGLHGLGTLDPGKLLAWGAIPQLGPNQFAHHCTEFSLASFAMAGSFLRGDDGSFEPDVRPAVILFSGVNGLTHAMERPQTSAYTVGTSDYAGMNFRVGVDAAIQGRSILGGSSFGYYDLTGRSKYYVRRGGVSGVHEAINGSFPPNGTIYGYLMDFTTFGLSFLDSINIASRTDGAVNVPYPCLFQQPFSRLKFSCLGALQEATVSEELQSVTNELSYWRAQFFTKSLAFETRDLAACDPTKGFLTLGVEMGTGPLNAMASGTIGIYSNGNLITLADCQGPNAPLDPPFDSRLTLPNTLTIKKDDKESYTLTPVNRGYLNNWQVITNDFGWLNVAGKLDVTFFEDMLVHAHVNDLEFNPAVGSIQLMGGFPDPALSFHEGDNHFFNQNPFDTDNRGYPNGVTWQQYENGFDKPDARFRPRVQQKWLGIVNMDYPLKWSASSKDFSDFDNGANRNLLILKADHRCTYLSANKADLEFGATYNGIGALNPANFLVDGALGYLEEFQGTALNAALEPMFASMQALMAASMQGLFGPSMEDALRPSIDGMLAELQASYGADKLWGQGDQSRQAIITRWTTDDTNPDSVVRQLRNMVSLQGDEGEFIKKLREDYLDKIIKGAQALNDFITPENVNAIGGFAEKVAEVGEKAAEATGGKINLTKIEALVEKVTPKLQKLAEGFLEQKEGFENLTNVLGTGGEFAKNLEKIFTDANSDINDTSAKISTALVNWSDTVKQGVDMPFADTNALKTLFMQKMQESFFASFVAIASQRAVKERVYDPEKLLREAAASAFEEMNKVVKDLLSESLAGLGDKFESFLGEGGGSMAGSGIRGAATVVGDSIHELRLDLNLNLKAPDDMKFHGYVHIKELDSESDGGGCLAPGEMATEITAGATDVTVGWIYPDLKASIWGKFTLQGGIGEDNNPSDAGHLRGLGAGFELIGKIKFPGGQFSIDELGSAMAFGKDDNYFSAQCAMTFPKGIRGKGGVLFGKVCSLEPFFWDPDVGKLLGEPPFAGAYGYGEVWLPLSDLICPSCGCLFKLKAAVGTGIGLFETQNGTTFVGKLFAGGSGDLLCIVHIEGEITLLGVKNKTGLKMAGSGKVKGKLGWCPVCIKFDKSFHATYEDGKWHKD